MTTLSVELPAAFERLIHERLDAVERALLHSGMPRNERQTAIAEVESQIHEMLLQRAPAGIERHDVLAVLQQIDPPEAYLSAERNSADGASLTTRSQMAPPASPAISESAAPTYLAPRVSVLGLCSAAAAVIGSVSVLGIILGYTMDSEVVMLLCGIMALLMGILATIGGIVSMFRMYNSQGKVFGLMAAVFATLFLPLALMDLAQLFVLLLFGELGFYLSLGFNIVLTNGILIYLGWRFIASRMVPQAKIACG
jgi:hypothetical protein